LEKLEIFSKIAASSKSQKKKKKTCVLQMTIHVHKSSKLNQKNKDYQQNKGSKTH
jgi:hypothetical protein